MVSRERIYELILPQCKMLKIRMKITIKKIKTDVFINVYSPTAERGTANDS